MIISNFTGRGADYSNKKTSKTTHNWGFQTFWKSVERFLTRKSEQRPVYESLEGRQLMAVTGLVTQNTPLVAIGDELTTLTKNIGSGVDIGYGSDGSFVVVWDQETSAGNAGGVMAQMFSAKGTSLGSAFAVSTDTVNGQLDPAVAVNGDGSFMVVWRSNGGAFKSDIHGQLFDHTGASVGSEFTVNTFTDGDQIEPSIAATADGTFIVAWEGPQGVAIPAQDIYGQRYDGDGIKIGSEFLVATGSLTQTNAHVAAVDGAFVVVWNNPGQDGSNFGVFGQLFDNSGAKSGAEFQANTFTTGNQYFPKAAMAADGSFTVVWQSNGQGASLSGAYGQRFNSSAVKVASEFHIGSSTTLIQSFPTISMASDGSFVATWRDDDGDADGLSAQYFDQDGDPQGDSFRINATTTGNQRSPMAIPGSDGSFTMVWINGLIPASSISVQRLGLNQAPLINLPAPITITAGKDYTFTYADFISDAETALADLNITYNFKGYAGPDIAGLFTGVSVTSDGLKISTVASVYGAVSVIFTVTDKNLGTTTQSVDLVITSDTQIPVNKIGPEITDITPASTNAAIPAIAYSSNGTSVITWVEDTGAIRAQRYDSDGTALGSVIQVNTYTSGFSSTPAIAMADDGSFVIVWSSDDIDGDGYGIRAQRFDATGAAVDSEFTINETTTGDQLTPSIAMQADGSYFVTWTGDDGFGTGVFGANFNFDATGPGTEFRLNPVTFGNQYSSKVAGSNGSYVVTWTEDFDEDGEGTGIFAQRYTPADGWSSRFQVNTIGTGDQTNPQIAINPDGAFVIAWQSSGRDGDGQGVYRQLYDANGDRVDTEYQVNAYTAEDQIHPSVAMKQDGSFIVMWASAGSFYGDYAYVGQAYAANGFTDGGNFFVNTLDLNGAINANYGSALGVSPNGVFTALWTRKDGGSYTVLGQHLAINHTPESLSGAIVTFRENTTGSLVELSDYFDDDGGTGALEYTLVSDSNPGLLSLKHVAGTGEVSIQPLANTYGTTTLTVRATDEQGLSVESQIRVVVEAGEERYFVPVAKDAGIIEVDGYVESDSSTAGDGSYVVVRTDGAGAIFGLRYDSAGKAIAKEFLIADPAGADASAPSVASAFDGSFIVTWTQNDGTDSDIYALRYDASGNVIGSAFLVNTETFDYQYSPQVAAAADGRFIIGWATGTTLYGQLFDAQGEKVNYEFAISQSTSDIQSELALAMDVNGRSVATWRVSSSDGGDVYARAFDAVGTGSSDFLVSTITDVEQSQPSVAMSANGQFVITWKQSAFTDYLVYARLYDFNDIPASVIAIPVGDSSSPIIDMPSVAMGATGMFVVTWFTAGSAGDQPAIVAQRFDYCGCALSSEETLFDQFFGFPSSLSISSSPTGNFTVSWLKPVFGSDPGAVTSRSFAHTYQPILDNEIEDLSFWHGITSNLSYNLYNNFSAGFADLLFTIESNTNPSLLDIDIDDLSGLITFDYLGAQLGSADIVVKATAIDGSYITDTFTVSAAKFEATLKLDNKNSSYSGNFYTSFFDKTQVFVIATTGYSGGTIVDSFDMDAPDSGGPPSGDFSLTLTGEAGTSWVTLLGIGIDGPMTGKLYIEVSDAIAPEFEGFKSIPVATTATVGSLDLFFSEPIDTHSFDWNSVTLTRDGGANLIDATTGAGLTLTLVSASTNRYRISGLADLTKYVGNYVLTLVDGAVSDPAGNPLGAGGDIGWQMRASVPSVPVLGPTNAGPFEAGYTSTTNPTVVGTATPGSTVELYDQLDNLLGTALTDGSGAYSLTLGTLALGDYQIKARATGPTGYTTTYSSLGTFHVAANFVTPLQITQFPTVLNSPVTAVGLKFSGLLNLASFTWQDLDIRLNGSGPNLATSAITIDQTAPGSLWYRINLPASMTTSSGTYTLQVNRAGVLATDGKPLYNNISTTWTRKYNFVQINQFPTPITTSMTLVGFQSSVELDLATLSYEDIEIKLDGGPDLSMSGITIQRVSPTSLWYRINLPPSLTVPSGQYTIKVKGAAVLDKYGSSMGGDISTSWTRNYPFLQINPFPTPINISMNMVGFQSSVELNLASLTYASMRLTLNDGPDLSLPSITVERVIPTANWYRFKLPPSMTLANGTYKFTVIAANVQDIYGHTMHADIQTSWIKV
jgi:hypothetical protein